MIEWLQKEEKDGTMTAPTRAALATRFAISSFEISMPYSVDA